MLDNHIASLITQLAGESCAEGAAVRVTDALTTLLSERQVTVERVWVQLSEDQLTEPDAIAPLHGVATAWLSAHPGPSLMQPRAGRARQIPGGAWSPIAPLSASVGTGVLLWPMRAPGGKQTGLVGAVLSAELSENDGLTSAMTTAQVLVDAAAPTVSALPRRVGDAATRSDPLLPVVGAEMARVIDTLGCYARTDEVLLLRGPTGTGKSRLARWCWSRSARRDAPLVIANLLGVPETGQDSELFGVRRGAFTGVSERVGQVTQAQGGTLFIDEVDKLSLAAQVKLLRLLDERVYRVVGETREREADLRFILASNADLELAVQEGRFLEDLYYRICVLPVWIPPLAERRDEIAPWARHMAREWCGRSERSALLSAAAEARLRAHPWPGNLRQLHNVLRRAFALASAEAEPGEPILLSRAHLDRALNFDPSGRGGVDLGVFEALRRTALAVVRTVEQRRASGLAPLDDRNGDLSLADAFRGLVLQVAVECTGDLKSAFTLFGLEDRIRGGNHLRTWRIAEEQVAMLSAALGAGAA